MILFVNSGDHVKAVNDALLETRRLLRICEAGRDEVVWIKQNKDREDVSGEVDKRARELLAVIESDRFALAYSFLRSAMLKINAGGKWDSLPCDNFVIERGTKRYEVEDFDNMINCLRDADQKANAEKSAVLSSPEAEEQKPAADTSNWPNQASVAEKTRLSASTISRAVKDGQLTVLDGKVDPSSIGPWLLNRKADSEEDRPLERAKTRTVWHCGNCNTPMPAGVEKPHCKKCKTSEHVRPGRMEI